MSVKGTQQADSPKEMRQKFSACLLCRSDDDDKGSALMEMWSDEAEQTHKKIALTMGVTLRLVMSSHCNSILFFCPASATCHDR